MLYMLKKNIFLGAPSNSPKGGAGGGAGGGSFSFQRHKVNKFLLNANTYCLFFQSESDMMIYRKQNVNCEQDVADTIKCQEREYDVVEYANGEQS